ncbi:MAG: hypothetical protein COA79_00410 [Planctomycetota bacterium]|nr:MAG: hypothetical protein COA79_00410 [Planctomycetota bacterium]
MYQIFFEVLSVIFPVFVLIAIGYFCGLKRIFSQKTSAEINRFLFNFSLPALLASKISQADLQISDHLTSIYACCVSTVIVTIVSIILLKHQFGKSSSVWVGAHAGYRSNMAFIGLPLIFYSIGDHGLSLGAIVMGFIVPFYNILGVVLLVQGQENDKDQNDLFKNSIIGILKNPLIWGCIVGGLLIPFNIPSQNVGMRSLDLLGSISLPLSLICIGLQLELNISYARIKKVFIPVVMKLLLSPLIGYLCLLILGFNELDDVTVVLILMGCPSAVATYVMALEMKVDYKYAADVVLCATLMSFITLPLILIFLRIYGYWTPI